MKNKLVLWLSAIIISIIFCETLNAQNIIGIHGYGIKSKISTDTNLLNKLNGFVKGYGTGIMYKHIDFGPLGFQIELNYEKSGFVFNGENINYEQKLTYLSIPLMMHADIGKHTIHTLLTFGPYINVLLETPNPTTNIYTISLNGFSKIYSSNFNRFSYGLMGEGGFAFCTKVGVFQITLRGCIGMSNLLHYEDITLFNLTLPRTFGFGIGYVVPFGEIPYYTKRDKNIEDIYVEETADPSLFTPEYNQNDSTLTDSTKVIKSSSIKENKIKDKKQKSIKKNKGKNQVETKQESNETEIKTTDPIEKSKLKENE